MKKFFLVSLLLGWLVLGLATPVVAASTIPEFNPLCWKMDDCKNRRKEFNVNASDEVLKKGWVKDPIECPGEEWGKCLPGGQTITTISFGGQNKFSDLGSFVTQMYRYAIGVAGIVAVIVVTISGIQWAASAGSADVISSAKTRIGGALIGLCLVYLSYTILNTINPNLVNFRLPNVWMLKPRAITPQFCADFSDTIKNKKSFALAAETDDQEVKLVAPTSGLQYALTFKNENPKDNNEMNFYCGKRFYAEGAGANTCWGDYCKTENNTRAFCVKNFQTQSYECRTGEAFGTVTYLAQPDSIANSVFTETWENNPLDKVAIYWACNEKNAGGGAESWGGYGFQESSISTVGEKVQDFSVRFTKGTMDDLLKSSEDGCKKYGGVRGYFLWVSLNEDADPIDEDHAIGRNGEDLGDRGFFSNFYDKIPENYFYTKQELLKGLRVQFDAGSIRDIDANMTDIYADSARTVYYEKFNLTSFYSK